MLQGDRLQYGSARSERLYGTRSWPHRLPVLPGYFRVLLALEEVHNLPDNSIYDGLLNASAIGHILMRNASVSGAELMSGRDRGRLCDGCQRCRLDHGRDPQMSLHAGSFALSNLLGLVCDPIAGLVESPCQSRNAIGVANAITSAELALSGIRHPIPFDEMAEAMHRVGQSLPFELRETAMGGCAGTPTGCALGCSIRGNNIYRLDCNRFPAN